MLQAPAGVPGISPAAGARFLALCDALRAFNRAQGEKGNTLCSQIGDLARAARGAWCWTGSAPPQKGFPGWDVSHVRAISERVSYSAERKLHLRQGVERELRENTPNEKLPSSETRAFIGPVVVPGGVCSRRGPSTLSTTREIHPPTQPAPLSVLPPRDGRDFMPGSSWWPLN